MYTVNLDLTPPFPQSKFWHYKVVWQTIEGHLYKKNIEEMEISSGT